MGCRLWYRYDRKDDQNAPTVLLLHGWGCDGSIFSFIQTAFSDKASVLAPDFPGHGKSGEPPEPWGVPEYAAQLLTLLRTLEIERVMIVAHSFGARVAIELASKYPALVEKLVITGGAGIRKPVSKSQEKRQKQYKRYQKLLLSLQAFPPLAKPAQNLQAALRRRYGSADYQKLDEVMRQSFVKIISLDLLAQLPQIAAPTLLIWGDEDTETPLWMGREMEKEIPDAGLVVFEGGTHFAFIEEWRRFMVIVEAFFWGGDQA